MSDLYQLLDHLVQGVQEIPHQKVNPKDSQGVANAMEHYYSERGRWIEQTIKEINLYIEEKVRLARLGEVKLAHHVIFPDLGVLTPDLIDEYLLNRIEELRNK